MLYFKQQRPSAPGTSWLSDRLDWIQVFPDYEANGGCTSYVDDRWGRVKQIGTIIGPLNINQVYVFFVNLKNAFKS